ncbi:XK-related protein [Caenorhabditis elegans]|uniref:XK-related protein n=1 Tax=Caenorhabditis elegans TaxID=6239 RepID=Q4PIV8_CAEEL|nr:XK-related protein [Caenorhabditis elegans]CCD64530.2 XK-related protein [Caenorhabditis elegans]
MSAPSNKTTSWWSDTKHVFHTCTKGYEAKMINVVGYSILQVLLDLTVLQLMLRFSITSYRLDSKDLNSINLDQEIEPTADNIKLVALFFLTTITGAVIAVYRHAFGAALLVLTQVVMCFGVFNLFSKPMIIVTLEKFGSEENFLESQFLLGFYNCLVTFACCLVYFLPTVLGIWFMYCTVIVMLVFMGFKIYEEQDANIVTSSQANVSTSSSDRSTPAETDYFSDNSSI